LITVEFTAEGYKCFDSFGYPLFSSDKKHHALFDYVHKDLSPLVQLLSQYLSKRINTTTLAVVLGPHRSEEITEIQSTLESLHPYYKHMPHICKETIIQAIGTYFNELLLYLCYNLRTFDPDFSEKWYLDTLNFLLAPIISIGDCHAGRFYQAYQEQTGNNIFTGGADASEIEVLISDVPANLPTLFASEITTQRTVRNMLCFILDTSVAELAHLSIPQRTWLYERIFSFSTPKPPTRLSFFSATYYQNKDPEYNSKYHDTFYSLEKLRYTDIMRDGISSEIEEPLSSAIELVKVEASCQLGEVYGIDNLCQLLMLEIMFMVQDYTMIRKCKNCGKYFIIKDRKKVYCDRSDQFGRTCSSLGSMRTFQNKMSSEPALDLYTRAYKTHYARRKRGNMNQVEFEQWCTMAKTNLTKVRSGALSITEFQNYLEKDTRVRSRKCSTPKP